MRMSSTLFTEDEFKLLHKLSKLVCLEDKMFVSGRQLLVLLMLSSSPMTVGAVHERLLALGIKLSMAAVRDILWRLKIKGYLDNFRDLRPGSKGYHHSQFYWELKRETVKTLRGYLS